MVYIVGIVVLDSELAFSISFQSVHQYIQICLSSS